MIHKVFFADENIAWQQEHRAIEIQNSITNSFR
jgi:hypothetical protein